MADKADIFHTRMTEQVGPGSSAKELIQHIVRSALEVEFGSAFTLNPGFAKMVSKIADAVVTNPDLRRQALSIAGAYIDKKMDAIKLRPQQPIKILSEAVKNDRK